MHEAVAITSWEADPVEIDVTLRADADFADIFEVRQPFAAAPRPKAARRDELGSIRLDAADGTRATVIGLAPPSDAAADGVRRWRVHLRARRPVAPGPGRRRGRRRRTGWGTARPALDERPVAVTSESRRSWGGRFSGRWTTWTASRCPTGLDERRHAPGGRDPLVRGALQQDTIISAMQARAFQPWRALHTLAALAARQGRAHDPGSEEEPGKILHEVRFSQRAWLGEGTTGGARPYYGRSTRRRSS